MEPIEFSRVATRPAAAFWAQRNACLNQGAISARFSNSSVELKWWRMSDRQKTLDFGRDILRRNGPGDSEIGPDLGHDRTPIGQQHLIADEAAGKPRVCRSVSRKLRSHSSSALASGMPP